MPFEPITGSLGVLGSLIGFVGFLVNTIENVRIRWDNYENCAIHLEQSWCRLDVCRLRLEDWQATWQVVPGAEEQLFVRAWGSDGFDLIVGRVRDVCVLITALKRSIFMDRDSQEAQGDQDEAELVAWRGISSKRAYGPRLNTCQKIVQTLWGKRLILDRIAELQGSIDDIIELSRRHHRIEHFENGSEAEAMLEADAWLGDARDFAMYMQSLQERQRESNKVSWSLVLQRPDDQKDDYNCRHCVTCLKEGHELHIHFVLQQKSHGIGPEGRASTVTFRYTKDGMNNDTEPEYVKNHAPLQVFKRPLFEDRSDSLVATKIQELKRASSALASTNWALLLTGTSWLAEASISNIHYMQFDEPLNKKAAECGFYVAEIPASMSSGVGHDGCPANCFLRLGVLLAEIAIGNPIILTQECPLRFAIGDDEVNQQSLLSMVVSKFALTTYRDAVRTCFSLHAKLLRRVSMPIGILSRALKEVLEPVERHFKVIEKKHMSASNMDWYKRAKLQYESARQGEYEKVLIFDDKDGYCFPKPLSQPLLRREPRNVRDRKPALV